MTMNAQWRTFLEEQGAHIEDGYVTDFARLGREAPAALDADILSDLSHEALIKVSGADARVFLQGQLSTEVSALAAEQSQLSAYHSPQGRVLAILRLFAHDDGVYLVLPAALREAVQKRLSMFVLRAKATIADASATLARFGLAGPNAPVLLEEAGIPAPAVPNQAVAVEGAVVIRLHGAVPRFQCVGSAPTLRRLWQSLAGRTAAAGEADWSLRRILAGVPTVYPATQDRFLPQMLNLHELGALDFKKGCYTGQEVIARLQYRGTLKRRLARGKLASETGVAPGAALYVAGEEQPAGEVVDARRLAAGGQVLLAVVRVAVLEQHTVLHLEAGGAEVEMAGLSLLFPEGEG
jgi:folate-binding protein YgfZ